MRCSSTALLFQLKKIERKKTETSGARVSLNFSDLEDAFTDL